MLTNSIKKGMRVQLANGWFGTMMDNCRGNTRVVNVEGYETEAGSVYAHDIAEVLVNNSWIAVEHTPAQVKLKSLVEGLAKY